MNDEQQNSDDAFQRLADAELALWSAILDTIEPLLMPLIIRLTRGIEWLTKHHNQT